MKVIKNIKITVVDTILTPSRDEAYEKVPIEF